MLQNHGISLSFSYPTKDTISTIVHQLMSQMIMIKHFHWRLPHQQETLSTFHRYLKLIKSSKHPSLPMPWYLRQEVIIRLYFLLVVPCLKTLISLFVCFPDDALEEERKEINIVINKFLKDSNIFLLSPA